MVRHEGPAALARAAMRAVEAGRREDWLSRFAADVRVEDPVGHLPPIAGRDSLAAFWDGAISALRSTRFEVSRQWEAGDEAMLIATVHVVAADGASATYEGAFNYEVDADGAIVFLRAFWDLPAVAAALAGPPSPPGA
jgi:ketosteroid isomerase-like protein